MVSPTWWTWVLVNSRSWWWTGRPGVLWFMGLQRVRHDWVTELNWTDLISRVHHSKYSIGQVSLTVEVTEYPKATRDLSCSWLMVCYIKVNDLWGLGDFLKTKLLIFWKMLVFIFPHLNLTRGNKFFPENDYKSSALGYMHVCVWAWVCLCLSVKCVCVCVCVCVCACAQEREIPASGIPLCRAKMLFTDIYSHILTYQ